MPNYDFLCQSCGTLSEEYYSMKDVPRESVCPDCGGPTGQSITDRQFTMPNGWSDGKTIFQLHPSDPLRHVESESQMVEAYSKAGIDMDTAESDGTGKFERRTNYFHSKRKPSKARPKRKTK